MQRLLNDVLKIYVHICKPFAENDSGYLYVVYHIMEMQYCMFVISVFLGNELVIFNIKIFEENLSNFIIQYKMPVE